MKAKQFRYKTVFCFSHTHTHTHTHTLSKIGPNRSIQLGGIKKYRLDGTVMDTAVQTKILNSPMRKMEMLFNCIPGHIRDIKKRPTEYFKKLLDEWLKGVPDQPKCGIYAGRCEGIV